MKRKYCLNCFASLLLVSLVFPVFSQVEKSTDSLKKVMAGEKDPVKRRTAGIKLVDHYSILGKSESAEALNLEIIRESRLAGDNRNLALAYHNQFAFLFQRNEIDSARMYNDTLLKLAQATNNKQKIIESLNNTGSVNFSQDNYEKALVYYDSALRMEAKFGFKEGQYASLNNIGLIYLESNIPRMAINYFKKSAKNSLEAKKNRPLIYAYTCLADAYTTLAKHDSALYYATLSLQVSVASNNIIKIAHSHCAIGTTYKALEKYDSALVHYNEAMEINKSLHDLELSYNIYSLQAETYYHMNRMKEAMDAAEKVRSLEKEFTTIGEQKQLYNLFAAIDYRNKKYKSAYDYLESYMKFRDNYYNEKVSAQISEINTKYETEKKEKENQLLQAQNQLSQSTIREQKTITLFTIIGLAITLSLLYFIFRGLKNQKNANRIISDQKHLVEEKQKEILDSIHYAKRIQNTLLAHTDFVNENIPGNFILFKPKDIVSGDFYWATKREDLFYLAVCDSTGHGVPGAFMSLLNIGFLNEAINEKNIVSPDKILNHVRERLVNSISKEGQQDGFDGILMCLNKKTMEITYAAANNAPVIVSNGSFTHGDCDKMPVGKGERMADFTLHSVNLKPGDTLYLYTDGYADQFGGPKGKKFMYKQLNNLLADIAAKPLEEQKSILLDRFTDWQKELEQVDDVCIAGIHLY